MQVNQAGEDAFGQLAASFLVISVIAGFIGGLIAPYSYGKLVKYIALTVGLIVLIAVVSFMLFGDAFWESEGLVGLLLFILLLVIVVALVVVVVVTGLGLFLGALLGSLIGKTFQEDYNYQDDKNADYEMPTL